VLIVLIGLFVLLLLASVVLRRQERQKE
jgi:hypothetical protein